MSDWREWVRLALTITVAIAALLVARWMWIHYERTPWTRDGRVRADVVQIAPDVPGLVVEVTVVDNQPVHKGQVLLVIDRSRYRLALAQAEAEILSDQAALAEAKREARRNLRLGSLVPVETLQQSTTRVQQLEAALAQALAARDTAALNLSRTIVISSVNGTATNVELRPGDYATTGRTVMAVVDRDSLHIDGYFEETKLPFVHIGDPVIAYPMGLSVPIEGHVESIAGGIVDRERTPSETLLPNVNPTFAWVRLAQRIPVRIHIDRVPPGFRLVAGRTVTVYVKSNKAPAEPGPRFWPW